MSNTFLLKMFLKCIIIISSTVNTNANITIYEEMKTLHYVTKMLSDHLEKWDNLFLTSLEPRMISTASSLSSIDTKINNLQERAHVWDTFQLHVVAWNDQLAAMDRKIDIISKGQEKILALESKINTIVNIEHKTDNVLEKLSSIRDRVSDLKQESQNSYNYKDHGNIFGEFAARGVLSSVKAIEKKLDRLLFSQQNVFQYKTVNEKRKLSIQCNTPHRVEELLNDISSKVDIIFDKISGKVDNENDYGGEDYTDEGSGGNLEGEYKKLIKKRNVVERNDTDLLEAMWRIEEMSRDILLQQNLGFEKLQQVFETCKSNSAFEKIIKEHFEKQKKYFESFLELKRYTTVLPPTYDIGVENENSTKKEPSNNKKACEDLDRTYKSGIYIFENYTEVNFKNRSYYKRYCEIRGNLSWTVIQRREKHTQNFNLSWFDYKHGFGDLDGDFWFGNDFMSRLSKRDDLILRVELEDFDGHRVWAEYKLFLVLPEENNYQIIIRGYRGNASDSFSSHNGSLFSTFDKKNDKAPECCPCAVSYGGGWWFNSCFESNLNGVYHTLGENNGYFQGIIWENWLGNYSLKKTLMMVRILEKQLYETTTPWPFYEDP